MELSISFLLVLFFIGSVEARVSCKGLNGESVDWFFAYKLPEGSQGTDGYSFAFADNKSPEWSLSRKSIDDEKSAIGATVSQVYGESTSTFRFLYNDDSPMKGSDGYRGHAKGVLYFDHSTGFWLIHSVPNYPPLNKYSYPKTAAKYGQSFLCVSVEADSLNNIGEHLKYIQATPFDIGLPEDFANRYPVLRTIAQKKSIAKSTVKYTLVNALVTKGGARFQAFAKHKKFEKDLWLDLIVPSMGASLGVESWLNGGADDLKSKCGSNGNVLDVDEISVLGARFPSSKDHSKWAVSDDPRRPIVCVGDLNRQKSQLKRGGGALCLENAQLWQTYRSSVSHVSPCRSNGVHQKWGNWITLAIYFLILIVPRLF